MGFSAEATGSASYRGKSNPDRWDRSTVCDHLREITPISEVEAGSSDLDRGTIDGNQLIIDSQTAVGRHLEPMPADGAGSSEIPVRVIRAADHRRRIRGGDGLGPQPVGGDLVRGLDRDGARESLVARRAEVA